MPIAVLYPVGGQEAQGSFHFCGIFPFDGLASQHLRYGPVEFIFGFFDVGTNAVNALRFVVKTVITQFIIDVHHQQQTKSDAHRKSQYVKQRVAPVFQQIAEGNGEIIVQHGDLF